MRLMRGVSNNLESSSVLTYKFLANHRKTKSKWEWLGFNNEAIQKKTETNSWVEKRWKWEYAMKKNNESVKENQERKKIVTQGLTIKKQW
jgi:hypothetical protein